jgi:hypothetical protein
METVFVPKGAIFSLLYMHLQAVSRGKNIRELLRKHVYDEVEAKDIVWSLITDNTKADKDRLPNTGCDPDWEHAWTLFHLHRGAN